MSHKIIPGLVTYLQKLKLTLLLKLEKLLSRVNYVKVKHKMYITPQSE